MFCTVPPDVYLFLLNTWSVLIQSKALHVFEFKMRHEAPTLQGELKSHPFGFPPLRLATELKSRQSDFPDVTSGAYVIEVISQTPAATWVSPQHLRTAGALVARWTSNRDGVTSTTCVFTGRLKGLRICSSAWIIWSEFDFTASSNIRDTFFTWLRSVMKLVTWENR